jgi:cytochrome c5
VLTLAGCATVQLLPATPDQLALVQSRWPTVTAAGLENGRILYGDRCSGCHALPDPREHSIETWPPQVARMTEPAHLSAEQAELITRYLQAVAPP